MKIFFALMLCLMCLGCDSEPCYPASNFSNQELANAIFKAEGGYKAKYLYGIVSVPYKDEAGARRICLNTIRNQYKRHARHNCGKDYLQCLADRYCPINASNDPSGLNKNWLRNVCWFLISS